MERINLFLFNIRQDLKLFFSLWCMTLVCRILFIFTFWDRLQQVRLEEIIDCIITGARLSFNSVGWVVLFSIVFISLPTVLFAVSRSNRFRYIFASIVTILYGAIFALSIPYYEAFQAAYDFNVFNVFYDDFSAIAYAAVLEYGLISKIIYLFLGSFCTVWLYKRIFKNEYMTGGRIKDNKEIVFWTLLTIGGLYGFVLLTRFGGSFTGYNAIKYDNAQRYTSPVLNVAVLDSGQALKRLYGIYKQVRSVKYDVTDKTKIKEYISLLDGDINASTLADSFRKVKETPPYFQKMPQNIVVIIGESFGNWPTMERYKNMNLVPNLSALMDSENSIVVPSFLSDGNNTGAAITSILTGLPVNDLHINYLPQTYKEPYATGLGVQMKKLGYRTIFWYSGSGDWQNIKKFVLSQGFDEFYGIDSYTCSEVNVWGCSDKELFENVLKKISLRNKNEMTLNVILTTSNHAPYNLDLVAEGFPEEAVRRALPDNISNDNNSMIHLGYIWYTDKYIGKFIKDIELLQKDTLFVVTGDHSERFDFAKEVSIKEKSSVPCVFYNKSIDRKQFDKNIKGSQVQITTTLIDLVAPKKFEFFSIRHSLLKPSEYMYNFKFLVNGEKWEESDTLKNDMRSIARKRKAEMVLSNKWAISGVNLD